jgi:DNA end-binding protein Ku
MAALWRGFLRLSLVSCPVSVTPATSERSRITLNQLNQKTGNRVRQRLVDEQTGEEVPRDDIVKGYQIEKDRYVVVDEQKLKDLQIESSKVIDLETFVDLGSIDRLHLDKPYYLAPDGPIGTDTFRVIVHALRDKGRIALGRVVISGREHMVAIEPYDGTLLMTTMRAANEVKRPEFQDSGAEVNEEAVELAQMIIDKKTGVFDAGAIHDRYQDALRNLVEETAKGHEIVTPQVLTPAPVIDLMAALKRSLADVSAGKPPAKAAKGKKKAPDARQRNLMLPVKGGKTEPAAAQQQPKRGASRKRA